MLEIGWRMVGQFIDAAGSVVGYRHSTEEPAHSTEKLTRDVEIRRYGDRIAAETTVVADEESARNVGFRRLARYIFGANNDRRESRDDGAGGTGIPPQGRVGDPVLHAGRQNTWITLPEPDDGEVNLVTVPPATIAVRRFTGIPSRRAVASQTGKLMNTLGELGFEATDSPAAWFYDPPWTVPALRRNEIAVPVKPGARSSVLTRGVEGP